MNWVYLSPHFDDVALSVGGLLWEQSQAGDQVSVWTICGGDPPPGEFSAFAEGLHARWETGSESISVRRAEDQESCRLLGAESVHFSIPDCIYRRSPKSHKHLYASEQALWIPAHPDEGPLVTQIAAEMSEKLLPDTQVVCPMTLGKHVDHRLTRMAAERMGVPLLYYADYPYILAAENQKVFEKKAAIHAVISNQALQVWQKAVAAHHSQISTFWANLDEMREAIRTYHQMMDGIKLFE
jgi:LmbE family N-acetylglucosaminyl deacetylase